MKKRSRNHYSAILVTLFLMFLYFMGQSNAASTWNLQNVDSNGDVGRDISMVLDSNRNPHISYHDSTNHDLKYAKWSGSGWITQTVDSVGSVGWDTSIALDSGGNPHISYTDETNEDLKYAKWTGSAWSIQTVDAAGGVGWYSSLALDSGSNPHISYRDYSNGRLKYAKLFGSAWAIQTVDSNGDVGLDTSIELDSSGKPHISYYDQANGDFKYASWSGSSWIIEVVDANGDTGRYTSIALDASDNPHISYYAYTSASEQYGYAYGELKYAKRTGSTWATQTIVPAGFAVGTNSLILDSKGNPHISYQYASSQNVKSLRYTYWTGSAWSTQTVDSAAGVGAFSSVAIDSNGNICVSYYDQTNGNLKYAQLAQSPDPLSTSLTVAFSPSTVNTTISENATISGTLTSQSSGVPNKTIKLYRQSGDAWTFIGETTTAAGGSYTFKWMVPNDLPSGSYRLKAEFGGDSGYSGCSVETDSPGIQVVPEFFLGAPFLLLILFITAIAIQKRKAFRAQYQF